MSLFPFPLCGYFLAAHPVSSQSYRMLDKNINEVKSATFFIFLETTYIKVSLCKFM